MCVRTGLHQVYILVFMHEYGYVDAPWIASSLHPCIHARVWVCGCTMEWVMGMWMHHGVGGGAS